MQTAEPVLPTSPASSFSSEELSDFDRRGYVISRGLVAKSTIDAIRAAAWEHLAREIEPIEYEAETEYPGAPKSLSAPGGRTARRLKQAFTRAAAFGNWVTQPEIIARVESLVGTPAVMPLAHHNCVMTKQPQFSSDTGWHQDIRYWSYERPELVSVWLAMTEERPENGSLRLIPGSHKWELPADAFDGDLFLREEFGRKESLFDQVIHVEMQPGDVLFFHCRTFHSASRNHTRETKLSAVYTFRGNDNPPLRETRSSASPEVILTPCRGR